MKYYFYIVRTVDGNLYIGSSNNLNRRLIQHNSGRGAKFMKDHGEAEMVYSEEYSTYLEARHREIQVKKWSRQKKENLIRGIKP